MFKNLYLTRKQEKILAAVICVVLMASVGAGMGIYYETIRVPSAIKAQQEMQTMEKDNEVSKEVDIVIAKEYIKQGDVLTAANLDYVKFPLDKLPQGTVREKFMAEGKVTKVDIPSKMPLVPEMLVEYDKVVTADLRRQDFTYIKLITGLMKSIPEMKQYVDVRIKRPDGSDDVVLSKKEVVDLSGSTIFFNINELERALANSAAVEAQLKNCEIYTTLYIDPDNQPSAAVTYVTNPEIAKMIEKNPNIIYQSIQQLQQGMTQGQPQQSGQPGAQHVAPQNGQPVPNAGNGNVQNNQAAPNNENWQNLND